MVHRIHKFVVRYIDFVSGREKKVLIIAFLIFVASLSASLFLNLKSDLKELLPPDSKSVKELNRALEKVGGVGSLIVVADGPDVVANKKFMDDLAFRLSKLPSGYIRSINYRADEIRQYYEDHFLYYIDTPDLELFYSRLKKRIDYEKFKRTPLFFSLDDEEDEVPPEVSFEDIKERNQKHYSAPISTVDDYYGGEWGRLLIMVIRPYGATITIDSARSLVNVVENEVKTLNPQNYDPRMSVGFCGNVKSTIDEYETLKNDTLSTALLCIALVAASIVIYFLRLRVVFLLGATLIQAIAWTFALTKIVIGYLNAQTAFLGSIIVGTGINYGIILLGRYLEERKKHKEPTDAMKVAVEMTARPTFFAAATTAVAFVVLMIARIRGLSQFGFIGATGVMFCWLSTVLILPVMTIESEKILRLVKPRSTPQRKSALFEVASRVCSHFPKGIVIGASILAILSLVIVARFAPNSIEYDFTKMRNQVSVSSGTEALEKRVSKLFKNSMTPSVVLVESVKEGREVCDAVMKKNNSLPVSEQRVGSCHSIYDLLPQDQEAKLAIMAKIDELLSQPWAEKAKEDLKDKIDKVKKSILYRQLTIDDLPSALTRHFEDLSGRLGAVVFINPRPGMLLSDGRNLTRYADTIREIVMPDGKVVNAVSESIIFSDLIEIIKKEAPILTFASLIAVIIVVVLMLRKMKISAVIIVGLMWAVVVMVGIAALLNIKINFFNFIILPLTFGIGVDYGINMAMRIIQEGPGGVGNAIRHTGGAVVLCSVTTIIGYWVLTQANNQALATFGVAAVIGELTSIVAAIVVVPAVIVLMERVKK